MPYLICEKCGGHYHLKEGESTEDFEKCTCGGKLVYTDKIGHQEGQITQRPSKTKSNPKTSFWNLSNIGLILMILGVIGLIFAFFSPFLFIFNLPADNPESFFGIFVQIIWTYIISIIVMFLGLILFLAANWNKNQHNIHNKVSVLENYFKELSEDYFILKQIRLPGVRYKIGYLVLGPNGIFIIENYNLPGYFIIEGNDWWKDTGNKRMKLLSNPGIQLKNKTMELRRFLSSKNLFLEYIWMHPIVIIDSEQFRVDEVPRNYTLLDSDKLSEFILNKKSRLDSELLLKAVKILEPYAR